MNADALAMLKAAAAKKKSNFKDPVVKQVKVTKEQYLQEKAEAEAKKNKKKAFLMGDSDSGAMGGGGPDPRVTELLAQVQRERSAFLQEKQQWAQQMQELKEQVKQVQKLKNGRNSGGSGETAAAVDTSLREDLDSVLERLKTVEKENGKLRKQVEEATTQAETAKKMASTAKKAVAMSSSSSAPASGVDSDDLDDLVDRIETLEEKYSKLILSTAQDSSTLEDTADSLKTLEKRVAALEKGAAKRETSRARSTTRKATESTTPVTPTKQSKPSVTKVSVDPEPAREKAPTSEPAAAASDVLGPHTAQEVAHGQASDSKLVAYLEGKSAGMYPKFSMSVKDVDGLKLVFFYKKLYVPEKLRQKTLKYYHDKHGSGSWTRVLSKQVIWPSLDADVTTFKP